MHAEQSQPDHHSGRERGVDGSDGAKNESQPPDHEATQSDRGTSVRDHETRDEHGLLPLQTIARRASRDELDRAGLQPETGLEHPELSRTDESRDATGLKAEAQAFFTFYLTYNLPE